MWSILFERETDNNERERKKDQRIEFDEIEIGVKEWDEIRVGVLREEKKQDDRYMEINCD